MKYVQLVVLLSVLTLPVLGQPAQPSSSAPGLWNLLLLALLIGAGVCIWLMWTKLMRHRQEIESLKNRFSDHLDQTAQQTSVNEIKKQVEILVANHPNWENAEKDMNALIGRLETLEAVRQTPKTPLQDINLKKEKRPQTETFYMTFPVGNYFPITAKSDTRDNTIYKFRVRPNKTEADFEVHTAGAPMQELIGMVQTYIKPACDEENMPSAQVRTIVTTQAGMAALEGDKWIIKKKALIRYE